MKKITLAIGCLLVGLSIYAQTDNYLKEVAQGHTYGIIKNLKTVPKSLNFLIMGDWGRHGIPHQRNVAEQMTNATEGLGATFNLIVGDNFYPSGVVSEFDPSWKSSFEDVYYQHPLFDDWYVALGNHDYVTNPDAEVAYSKISARWHMPARYFSFTKKLKDGTTVEFFIIDSSPFQTAYYNSDVYQKTLAGNDTTAQKQWLEDGLKKSTATWKFVVGHHPLFNVGSANPDDMLYSFGPLFEKYKIDGYICGHEHILMYEKPKGYHFVEIISGSGGEASAILKKDEADFAVQDYGFVAASLTAKSLLLQYINEKGEILYTTEVKK